ncbi:hypothetical protein HDU67_005595 [Dinochytrium kinnereticum]|nr:hypothetical protein HDU67_005595 [Dinochytrium kinnereticum]
MEDSGVSAKAMEDAAAVEEHMAQGLRECRGGSTRSGPPRPFQRSRSLSGASRDGRSGSVAGTPNAKPRRLSFQQAIEEIEIPERLAAKAPSAEALKQLRWLRAMGKRHERTTVHLEKFIRLSVTVDRPPVSFTVVVDKTQSIEYLSHLSEAEYSYKFLLPVKAVPEDSGEKTISRTLPLECGLLYDSAMISLRYDDKIEDVLDLDCDLHVMNVFEGLEVSNFEPKLKQAMANFMEDVDDDADDSCVVNPLLTAFRRSSIRNTFVTTPDSAKPNLDVINQSQDDMKLGENETGLAKDIDVEKCPGAESFGPKSTENDGAAEKIVVDGLVKDESSDAIPRKVSGRSGTGWRTFSMVGTTLDDRLQAVLRNKIALDYFHEFCIDDYSIENLLFWLGVESFQSCTPTLQHKYAKYIYHAFVSERAPLRINLSQEVLRDIAVPIEGKFVDQMIFDEAQQHIYSILKGHSFVRFEKSQKLMELMKTRSIVTTAVEEYKKANISTSYFDAFCMGDDQISRFAQECEALTMSNDNDSTAYRDRCLNSTIKAYFPSSKYLPVDGYFNDPSRLTQVKKKRKIHKEKKISKFFGERPSFEQLQRQLVAANLPQAGQEFSLAWTPGSARPILDALTENESQIENYLKRKKAEKLSEFFGTSLGKNQLRSQHLADTSDVEIPGNEDGSGSDEGEEPLETVNELDQETKRQLRLRSKKLVALLGDNNIHQEVAKCCVKKVE